jgi:hypothetical protein
LTTTLRAALLAFALAGASLAALPPPASFMPVDDVRAGMEGVGRTVFSGETPEEFAVHILGVLRNIVGPQRDLVLARLDGGPLAEAGVMQGMSGSPVYIDGRLLGAVSYALGTFSKVPIAGITPIGEMVEATAMATVRAPSTRVRLELPLSPERLTAALSTTLRRIQSFAADPADIEVVGLSRQAGAQLAFGLQPIATPFIMNGFAGPSADLLRGALRGAGFAPSAVPPSESQDPAPGSLLEPGDAVGLLVARGDLEVGASGTVTHVDGNRVYAFGHQFFNLGPTAFPMTRAAVHTLLPSLMTSQKVATLGSIVGTVEQDRTTAIAGTLGAGPSLIPVRVELDSDRGYAKRFAFDVVHDEFFTPLLVYLSIASALNGYERQVGTATFAVEGTATVAGHEALRLSDLFTGVEAAAGASSYVASPVTLLMANQIEPVRVEAINVTIRASEEPLSATIERAWLDEVRPRVGETLRLSVLLREYGGREQLHTVPVSLPPNAPRDLTLLVADATHMAQWEQREQQGSQQPQSVSQIIRVLNRRRPNNRVYVRLLATDAGAVVAGEPMPALPPSVLTVLEADPQASEFSRLRQAVLGAWDIPTGSAVSGSRTLAITVENGRM